MTATYDSLTRVDYGSRTNTTTNTPANTVAGDLLLLFCVTANSGTAVTPTWPPSGWTSFGSAQTDTDGSFGDRMSMAYRIATGSPGSGEASSHTITHASTNCETLMVLVKGSGTLSVDVFSQATNAIGANAVQATSVTPTGSDDLLLYVAINWDEVAWTPPSGMTERQDAQFIYLATQALAASGATGTRAVNSAATTTNPWMANLIAIKDDSAGSQTITGALFSNSQTFYGATAVPGAVTVTGGLFSNSGNFYGATVVPGSVTIVGARHDNSNSFYGATLATFYTVQGTLYSNSASFYQATVAPGAVTISGALYSNAQTFYGAAVAATYTITGALVSNTPVFYAATVSPDAVTISGALFSNSSTVYGATVSQDGAPQTITGARFDNSQAFYAATAAPGSVTITGAIYQNSPVFYGNIVSADGGPQTILAARYDNAGAFYGATVLPGAVTISGALYSDADDFYSASAVPTYGIVGSLVVNSSGFFASTVAASNVIAAARHDNAPAFFSATVSAPQDQVIVGGFYANDNTFFAANFPGAAPPPPARIMRVQAEDKTLIADATGRSLSVTGRARAA